MIIYPKLRDLLLQSGLSESEAVIYVELLKGSVGDIFDLVKRTGLSKSTVYRAFESLESRNLVKRNADGIRALSLKTLIADLNLKERKFRTIAHKIKKIAPFLRMPKDNLEEFETFYTPDQLKEAYLFMSEGDYDTNFDFGDFENFIKRAGGLASALKFRDNRVKHAVNRAICTTFGPYTSHFCTNEAKTKFKNTVNLMNGLDFTQKFVIFSDASDYVLFADVSDFEYPSATLVKSKAVADIQRSQFANFSRKLGKI